MGFVMQEPTLFNYSIKENILYGNPNATNSEIKEAAQVANACEFIESQELIDSYDDNANSLLSAMDIHEQELKTLLKTEEYDKLKSVMTNAAKEEKENGMFIAKKDDIDTRGKELLDVSLHTGYDINCGNRGSKLSGGQKQRVAIARAVLRQPNLLLLDEATSALDENSQKKVQEALDNIMVGRTSIVIAHRLTTVQKCNRIAVIEEGKVIEEGTFDDLKAQENGYFANLAAGM